MNYWPRWIRAIRGKTLHLSMARMGAYDRLLDYYYEEEKPLPGSVNDCCRIAGASTKQDRADVEAVLAQFFTLGERGYEQGRTEEEIAYAKPKLDAARANGKNGGRPKGSTKKPSGLFEETGHEPKPKAPQPQPSSLPSGKKKSASAPPVETVAAAELIGQGFDPQTAADFIACKAERAAPLTPRAWADHLREAAKAGWTPLAAAEKVMAKTWKGFEAKYVASEPPKVAQMQTFRERDAALMKAKSEAMMGSALPKFPQGEIIDMEESNAARLSLD